MARTPLIGREWTDEKGRLWRVVEMARPGVYRVVHKTTAKCLIGELQAALIRQKTEVHASQSAQIPTP
jgi:hypothetical protein